MHYEPIENYGVIGDLNTAALVSVGGSMDFLCFPRFDSPTIFAALLDDKKGGHFRIAPLSGEFKTKQCYFPETNILLTRFLGSSGVAEVSGFMALEHLSDNHSVVRRLKVVRGEIRFRMECAPRFDYGRAGHRLEKRPQEFLFIPEKRDLSALGLRADVPARCANGRVAVEALARGHDLKKARFLFEKALGYSNHLGLYAEQLGPCGEHLGNFPQALSHIALISAAWALENRLSKNE